MTLFLLVVLTDIVLARVISVVPARTMLSLFPRSFGFHPGLGGGIRYSPPQDVFSYAQDLDPFSVACSVGGSLVLFKYQGDLYGTDSFTGASVQSRGDAIHRPIRKCGGLFVDARPRSAPGFTLPVKFVSAFRCLDYDNLDKAFPRTVKRAFAFRNRTIWIFSPRKSSRRTLIFSRNP